jgi:hypothetical protein
MYHSFYLQCGAITFYACTYHSASEQSNNGGFYIHDKITNIEAPLLFDSDTGIPFGSFPTFEQQVE